jgi:hypothetical protein
MLEKGLSPKMKSASAPEPAQGEKFSAHAEKSAIPGDLPTTGEIPQDSDAIRAIPRSECGDFDIRIARDGTWFYRNSPIGRPAIVRLFATVLKRDAAGDYWLETPAERGRIVVEDAPFVAVEVTAAGDGAAQTLAFRTNIDARVIADAAHPIVLREGPQGDPRPYLMLDGGLEALIARPVFYALVERAAERRVGGVDMLGVWSAGEFFALGALPPEESAP